MTPGRGRLYAVCAAVASVAACAPAHVATRATIQSVEDSVRSGTAVLRGTFLLPAARRPPIALIIAGSGPTDRDGNSRGLPGKNNSLRYLAEGLAARGIATLRYDKRGIGASTAGISSESEADFSHFVADAVAWARRITADPRLGPLTIIGHSEGSLIGIITAQQTPARGVVSIAGAGQRAGDVLRTQLGAQLQAAMLANADTIISALERGQTVDSVPTAFGALFRRSVQPYLISWFRLDPAVEASKLRVPFLVVQGTTDVQVGVDAAERLARANPGAQLVVIEGMNHVLKEVSGTLLQQLPSYSDSTLRVMPRVVHEIAAFITATSR